MYKTGNGKRDSWRRNHILRENSLFVFDPFIAIWLAMRGHKLISAFFLLFVAAGCESPTDCCGQPPTADASIGRVGSGIDVTPATTPGFVLMGGSTDVDAAIRWMIERSGGGDFLILRASGSTGYNRYVQSLGNVNSVETLLIDSREKANWPSTAAKIRNAEAVFIAGGDQANYVQFWKDTGVDVALQYLIDEKKVPIGGTSAGCAILSDWIFDAARGSVTSAEALQNPFDERVSLSRFLSWPGLAGTVADQHFAQRERFGRLLVFMARVATTLQQPVVRGIGVDERTALAIEADGATRIFGVGSVYFLQSSLLPEACVAGTALTWDHHGQALQAEIRPGSPSGTEGIHLNRWEFSAPVTWRVVNGTLIF